MIAAILITKNNANTIEKTLYSLINQKSLPNYQILIFDKGSTDETVHKINDFKSRFPSKIKNITKKDVNENEIINYCLQQTNVKYVSIIDPNSILIDLNALYFMYKYLQTHHNAIGVCTKFKTEHTCMFGIENNEILCSSSLLIKRENIFNIYSNFNQIERFNMTTSMKINEYFNNSSETNEIKISVILPIYNTSKYLKQCLNSILGQTLKDIELICVDDGSTDDSLMIASTYAHNDKRIKIISQQHSNAGCARNIGITTAQGKYIYFMDSDDWMNSKTLETIYNYSEKHNADVSIFKYKCYNEKAKSFSPNARGFNTKIDVLHKDVNQYVKNLFCAATFTIWNKLFRRDFIVNQGIYFDEIDHYNDVTFSCLSLALAKTIAFLNKDLYYYRTSRDGSITEDKKRNTLVFVNALRSLKKKLKEKNIFDINYDNYMAVINKVTNFSNGLTKNKQTISVESVIEMLSTEEKEENQTITNEVVVKPTITTMITTYNHEKFIRQAIQSVVEQKGDFVHEILISDDGSTDNTPNIINEFAIKYPDLIKNISEPTNVGISNNMKRCFEHATGDFIAVLEGDDYWIDQNKLQAQSQFLLKNRDCSMVFSDIMIVNTKTKKIRISPNQSKLTEKVSERDLCKAKGLNVLSNFSCCMFKRDLINLIPEELYEGRLSEIPLQFFFLKYGLIGHIKKIMSMYRQHENGVWSGANSFNQLKQSLICLSQIKYVCSDNVKSVVSEYIKNTKLPINKFREFDSSQQIELLTILNKIGESFDVSNYKLLLDEWYFNKTKERMDWNNPRTFNEKIQWLKLYDSTPIKTKLSDKYLVRDWVKEKIGDKYLIPLLGVYDKFEDIDFSTLPDQFVIKCNHGSGYNIIVKNKQSIDLKQINAKINKWLSENFAFKAGYELQYKDIKPKILIEKYISNDEKALWDYKFWCFNGEVKYMQFRNDFKSDLKMVFYDMDWNKQSFYYDHGLYENDLEKPDNFNEMREIAKTLCQGFSFVCVDLYRLNNGEIKFGEMTFTRSSGIAKWNDNAINKQFGDMIELVSDNTNNRNMKFSIIMPTYNRKDIISNAIESILNQSYDNYELLIMDDCSTDNTKEFIEQTYKSQLNSGKIKYNCLTSKSGVCGARNKGLEIANGDWIAYCDSDNTWRSDYLKTVNDYLSNHENCNIIYGKIKSTTNGNEIGHPFSYKSLYERNFIDMNVFSHSYDMYKKYGGFDLNMSRLVDYDLILNYTLHDIPVFINKVFCDYNNGKHPRISNTESLEKNKKYLQNKYPFFRCNFDEFVN